MASFDMSALYHDHTTPRVLCFTCAVKAVMEGHVVTQEIDEFGQDGNDMRTTWCQDTDCPTRGI